MQSSTTDPGPLIPAVVQDARTGAVLMLAWMNPEARRLTEETRQVWFWSRSRRRLWRKGESSGNVLRLVDMKADCDADTLLVRAVPDGPTCHTGTTTCWGGGGAEPPANMLVALEQTIAQRKALPPGARSYVRHLLDGGFTRILGKLAEEGAEFGHEVVSGPRDKVIAEAADALFCFLVALGARDVTLAEIEAELARREGVSGIDEKASRPAK